MHESFSGIEFGDETVCRKCMTHEETITAIRVIQYRLFNKTGVGFAIIAVYLLVLFFLAKGARAPYFLI